MRTRIRQFATSTKVATLKLLAEASENLRHLRPQKPIAQGIKGEAELLYGDFKEFNGSEARAIAASLERGKTFVLLFDRDSIAVPANERASWIRHHFEHNPNLEVRVAYAAPETPEYSYLTTQIPGDIQITRHTQIENTVDTPMPIAKNRVRNPFQQLVSATIFDTITERHAHQLKQRIQESNPFHPNYHTMFDRTDWDLSQLKGCNLPVKIGHIGSHIARAAFSAPLITQVFDMPIYMPGQGWKIPAEFSDILPIIARIRATEALINPKIQQCNAYLTYDGGVVPPEGYARRNKRHVDGFKTKANARPDNEGKIRGDNTYIVSDLQALQTEFYAGPFDLSHIDVNNPQAVIAAFEAQGKNMPYYQANAYDILKLTVNNVHAVHQNLSGKHLYRTFLKVTFSENLFNRSGNTINPHLNYRFAIVPRNAAERNTQNYIGETPYGYTEVNLADIDFQNNRFPDWVVPTPFRIYKNAAVTITAKRATAGETLHTIVDGTLVTTNVAREGDMKVIRKGDDSYFLGKEFAQLYHHHRGDKYIPTPRTLNAVQVKKSVSMLGKWGTLQNIPAGGLIVENSRKEKYGVHEKSYKATYLKV